MPETTVTMIKEFLDKEVNKKAAPKDRSGFYDQVFFVI
jgi:hypothetical protein